MEDTGIVRFPGHLDPRAQEFRPRNLSPHNQIALIQPQIYYPYPSTYSLPGVQVIPFYDRGVGYQHVPSPAYYRPPSGGVQSLPPPSAAESRSLLLSSVPMDVNEEIVRRELEVFGEVRAVEMERLQDGIVTVHFYDLRHAQAAMIEIQEQHMQQQSRLRHHYNSLTQFMPSWGLERENSVLPLPPPCRGLIAGRAVWAQFTSPAVIAGPDGHNQGTLVVFNLDSGVSASKLKEIFETFGPIKELRETPSKRHQRFVEFYDIRDAAKALSEMDGKEINGQSVVIEFSRPGGNRRKLSNATIPYSSINSLNKNMSSTSFYNRITNCPQPPSSHPFPLKLFGNSSTSNISPSSNPQFQQTLKKPGSGRGLNSWNNNGRSNYGAGTAPLDQVPMGSLSLGVSEGMSFNGSSRRGVKNRDSTSTSNNFQSTITKQQGKQPKSKPWKGRQKISDSHFLINENAMVESSSIRDTRTTVMIKNIPNKYSQKLLLNMLDNHCIHCNEQISDGDDQPLSAFDFVYLPIDFNNKCNVGYGFVNLTSPQATWRLYKAFHLQQWEVFNSRKICEVTYARLQGLEALKEHFKNSKFACETDEYLPVVFSPPRDGKYLTEPMAIGGQGSAAAVLKKQILGGGGGGGICSGKGIGGQIEVSLQMDGQDDKLEGQDDHVDENSDDDDVEDGSSCKNDCKGNDGRNMSRNKEVVFGMKNSRSSTASLTTTTTGNCGSSSSSSSSSVVAASTNGCLSSSGPKQQPKVLSCAQVS
ncbi:RNA recognition motif domain [Macleaya cordata]|uniref:RNA recognition motif domain n=1 Tax=Macleaya cordata TaxID=56857 RepID=A0A200R4J9_MACCD|nr:RNA recognition motif domain [Macleaya cordata]